MKIAVFGFYNALNYGDDRLQYCITRLIQSQQDASICFIPHYIEPSVYYLNTFDWILIGGGGLVFEEVGIWKNLNQWLMWCTAKIGVIGIGINALPGQLSAKVLTLIDKSSFFFVRDLESKRLLGNHEKVKVFPDLSWCFPMRYFSSEIDWQVESSQIIALNLLPISWETKLSYEPQKWYQSAFSGENHCQIKPFPLNFRKQQDYDLLKLLFSDQPNQKVSKEFDRSLLHESKLVIACRFHAIVFAMQLRKPFIAINYDKKITRLVQEAELNDLMLELDENQSLSQKIGYVKDNYHEIVDRINIFSSDQEKRSQDMMSEFHDHVGTSSLMRHSFLERVLLKIKKKVSIFVS